MNIPTIKANEIIFDAVKTPLGWLSFALTGNGLLSSTFMYSSESEALLELRGRKIVASFDEVENAAFQTLLEQWRSFFVALLAPGTGAVSGAGITAIEIPIDQTGWTEFAKRVYDYLRRVPAGETVTYGEVAHAVGSPGASRAVGMLMKKNPIPPVVPCHRVLGADGKLGGFSAAGGPGLKQKMLQNEQDPKGLLFPPFA